MSARRRPERRGRPYLGYRPGDFDTPFARFFDPVVAPLAPPVVAALAAGPQPAALLTRLEEVANLLEPGDEPTENGYATAGDGSIVVAVRTPMPGVTPAMWDWWFGWHGDDPRKYKLWHPRAHLFAQWDDDRPATGPRGYVGRTSFVDEYLGSRLVRAAIRFLSPRALGFDEDRLDAAGATAICARVGSSQVPVDLGYLVHHVRPTADGAEMRSRFWIGPRHAALRSGPAGLSRVLPRLAAPAVRLGARDAADLLVHGAQEMAHLAAFLPPLHAELGGGEGS